MNKIESFERILNVHLSTRFDKTIPTSDQFDNMANEIRKSMESILNLSDEEFNAVKRRIQEYRAMDNANGIIIVDDTEEHELWYTKSKENLNNNNEYNDRYKKYLLTEKRWSDQVVTKQDENTDVIMDYLGNPNNLNSWSRKGLIIGDVQAGKTANYTAICNKVVDSGYKVIIILAGVTNTLRRQTQQRLEKDFVGYSKVTQKSQRGVIAPLEKIGVSNYGKVTVKVETFTSEDRDFSKVVADSITGTLDENSVPRLFVVKKVKSVLNNLFQWFENAAKSNASKMIDIPMLLIDDESDYASVNTSDDLNPTAINNGIRSILRIFKRNTYLGVTATPFANIFINPYLGQDSETDPDLFPKDFIYCLPTPTEYIGSEKIFGADSDYGQKAIEEILDTDMKAYFVYGHKKTIVFSGLPDSMQKSIYYFMLTNAIRDYRGHTGTHRSMLINVSRFVDVQNKLKDMVSMFFANILSDLRNYSKLEYEEAMKYNVIQNFKKLWDDYNLSKIAKCEWQHILKTHLFKANENVKIMAINQKSVDKLDYDNYSEGLRVIAVGGNCLSRGLTLEDLVVSYFYRNSQTYDTLMQMGRWFGYRPDYSDLVKLWISKDATAWYRHISESTEQLKLEIIKMNRNNLTPMDFGLKIKGHPDVLIPTARNKMHNASLEQKYLEVDIAGKLIESPRLLYNSKFTHLKDNYDLVIDFIKDLDQKGQKVDDELLWRDIKANKIADLVKNFKSSLWHWYFDSSTLSDYIVECNQNWDVSIQTGKGKNSIDIDTGSKHIVRLQSRKIELIGNKINISGTKVRVGKGECAKTGLDKKQIQELRNKFKMENPNKENVPDSVYLHTDRNPILFIHILEGNDESTQKIKEAPFMIVALGLGFVSKEEFNQNEKSKKIKVYLNKIASEIDMNIEEGDDENVD